MTACNTLTKAMCVWWMCWRFVHGRYGAERLLKKHLVAAGVSTYAYFYRSRRPSYVFRNNNRCSNQHQASTHLQQLTACVYSLCTTRYPGSPQARFVRSASAQSETVTASPDAVLDTPENPFRAELRRRASQNSSQKRARVARSPSAVVVEHGKADKEWWLRRARDLGINKRCPDWRESIEFVWRQPAARVRTPADSALHRPRPCVHTLTSCDRASCVRCVRLYVL